MRGMSLPFFGCLYLNHRDGEMSYIDDESTASLLVGKTLECVEINEDEDEIYFCCTDGEAFRAYHMQDCCESVSVHDISGSLQDLIGSPIVEAEEIIDSENWPSDVPQSECRDDSFRWTTHRLKAASGVEVVVRWLGESNGYYSESVYFQRTHKRGQ